MTKGWGGVPVSLNMDSDTQGHGLIREAVMLT